MVTTIVVNETSLGYDDWWLPCGCLPADCDVAYSPKGAASYANSLINLNNPGVNDANGSGHVPDWDTTNGWKFDGGTQYIDTGIDDTILPDGRTMIVKFSNYVVGVGDFSTICGSTGETGYFYIMSHDDCDVWGYGHSSLAVTRAYTQSGTRAIAGHRGYLDGNVDESLVSSNWNYSSSVKVFIGCQDAYGVGATEFSEVYVQAFALYNKVLSQEQIQEIIGRMP